MCRARAPVGCKARPAFRPPPGGGVAAGDPARAPWCSPPPLGVGAPTPTRGWSHSRRARPAVALLPCVRLGNAPSVVNSDYLQAAHCVECSRDAPATLPASCTRVTATRYGREARKRASQRRRASGLPRSLSSLFLLVSSAPPSLKSEKLTHRFGRGAVGGHECTSTPPVRRPTRASGSSPGIRRGGVEPPGDGGAHVGAGQGFIPA